MSCMQRHRGALVSPAGWQMAAGMLTVALTLTGCISVGIGTDAGVRPMYELHDTGAAPAAGTGQPPRTASLVPSLQIQMLPAGAVAETTSIAYSRQPHEVAFYQLASWNERPVRQVPRLLQQRLQASNVAAAVGLLGDPLRSDWLLTVAIDRLQHDVAMPPGQAQVRLTAAVYDRRDGQRIGSRSFDATAPVDRAESAAAVAAMSIALSRAFDALTPWLEQQLQVGLARRAAAAATTPTSIISPSPS